MYYTHNKSGVIYKFIQRALLQSDKGVWGDCIIYENKEGMTFVREQTDWDRSFTKKVFTAEEIQKDIDYCLEEEKDLYKFTNGTDFPGLMRISNKIYSLQKELEKVNTSEKPKFYKLLHKPTGLFYQPLKHRVGNLGTIGKVYAARKPLAPMQIKLCGTYKKKLCKREQLIKDFFNFEGYENRYVDTPLTDWEVIKIY